MTTSELRLLRAIIVACHGNVWTVPKQEPRGRNRVGDVVANTATYRRLDRLGLIEWREDFLSQGIRPTEAGRAAAR